MAIKFFLYTMLGSVLMLIAMLVFYFQTDFSFDLTKLATTAKHFSTDPVLFGLNMPQLLWIGLFINFAVKIPAFPFHTWLPDAHVEAPTAFSVSTTPCCQRRPFNSRLISWVHWGRGTLCTAPSVLSLSALLNRKT